MHSVPGNIRFVRSYPLASFGHVQNFERTLPDKDVWWMNVSCALVRVCGLSGSRACICRCPFDLSCGTPTSGHVTVKTDEYGMLDLDQASTVYPSPPKEISEVTDIPPPPQKKKKKKKKKKLKARRPPPPKKKNKIKKYWSSIF